MNRTNRSLFAAARALALAPTLIAPALVGCAYGTVRGDVDGEVIPSFKSGVVYEASALTEADDTVVVLALHTFAANDELFADHLDVKTEAIRDAMSTGDLEGAMDDVASFEEDNFPEDYWSAHLVLIGENESDIEDELSAEDANMGIVLCHHTGEVDAPREEPDAALFATLLTAGFRDANRDCFTTEEAEVTVEQYDGETISLTGFIELVDDENDDAGEVALTAVGVRSDLVEEAAEEHFEQVAELFAAIDASNAQPSSGGDNSCQFAFDGECDEPQGLDICDAGTDTADCG